MGKDSVEERERRPRRERRSKTTHVADWSKADRATLQAAISAAAATGGALRFGYSRDGGAYAIGVYGDGEPYTDFVSGVDDIDDTLADYIDLFNDIADDKATGQNGKKEAVAGAKASK